jgi:poly(3-hydroxyalkanoate) synthetase
MLFGTLAYRPGRRAAAVSVPAWLRAGTRDHLAPPDAVRAAAAKVRAETRVQELDASHIGEPLRRVRRCVQLAI